MGALVVNRIASRERHIAGDVAMIDSVVRAYATQEGATCQIIRNAHFD